MNLAADQATQPLVVVWVVVLCVLSHSGARAQGGVGSGHHNTLYTCGVCATDPVSLGSQPAIRAFLLSSQSVLQRLDNTSSFHILDRVAYRANPFQEVADAITLFRIAHVLTYSDLPNLIPLAERFPNVTFQALYTELLARESVPHNVQIALAGSEMSGYLGGAIVGMVASALAPQKRRVGLLLSRLDVSQIQTSHGLFDGVRHTCSDCSVDVRIGAATDARVAMAMANRMANEGTFAVVGFGAVLPAVYNISDRVYSFAVLANELANPLTFNNTNSSRSQRQLGSSTVDFLRTIVQGFTSLVSKTPPASSTTVPPEFRSGFLRLDRSALLFFPCVFSCAVVPRLSEATKLVTPIYDSLATGRIHFTFNPITGEKSIPTFVRANAVKGIVPIEDVINPPLAFAAPVGVVVSGRLVIYDPLAPSPTVTGAVAADFPSGSHVFALVPELQVIIPTTFESTTNPTSRTMAAIAANADASSVFLYGGRSGVTGAVLSDLWSGSFSCPFCGDFSWRPAVRIDESGMPPDSADPGGADTAFVYPTARYGAAMASGATPDIMYIMGGIGSDKRRKADLWCFNATSRRFVELPPDPSGPRALHSMATYRNTIWWLEGFDSPLDDDGELHSAKARGLWYLVVLGGDETGTTPRRLSIFSPHHNRWFLRALRSAAESTGQFFTPPHDAEAPFIFTRRTLSWRDGNVSSQDFVPTDVDFTAPSSGCLLIVDQRVLYGSTRRNADGTRQRALLSLDSREWQALDISTEGFNWTSAGTGVGTETTPPSAPSATADSDASSTLAAPRSPSIASIERFYDRVAGAADGVRASDLEACGNFADLLPTERGEDPHDKIFFVSRGSTDAGALRLLVKVVRNCDETRNLAPSLQGATCEPCPSGTFAHRSVCVPCSYFDNREARQRPAWCDVTERRRLSGENGFWALLLLLLLFVYLVYRSVRKRRKYHRVVSEEQIITDIAEATARMDPMRVAELRGVDNPSDQAALIDIAQLVEVYTQFMPHWLRYALKEQASLSSSSGGGGGSGGGASGSGVDVSGESTTAGATSEGASSSRQHNNSATVKSTPLISIVGAPAAYISDDASAARPPSHRPRAVDSDTGSFLSIMGGGAARQRANSKATKDQRVVAPAGGGAASMSEGRLPPRSPTGPGAAGRTGGSLGGGGDSDSTSPLHVSNRGPDGSSSSPKLNTSTMSNSSNSRWRHVLLRPALRHLTTQEISVFVVENISVNVFGRAALAEIEASASKFTDAVTKIADDWKGCVDAFIGDRAFVSFNGMIPRPHSDLVSLQAAFALVHDPALRDAGLALSAACATGPATVGFTGRVAGRSTVLFGSAISDARALLNVALTHGSPLLFFESTVRNAARQAQRSHALGMSSTWRDSLERGTPPHPSSSSQPHIPSAQQQQSGRPVDAPDAFAGAATTDAPQLLSTNMQPPGGDDEPPPIVNFNLGFEIGGPRTSHAAKDGHHATAGGSGVAGLSCGATGGNPTSGTSLPTSTFFYALASSLPDAVFRIVGIASRVGADSGASHRQLCEALSLRVLQSQLWARVERVKRKAQQELQKESIARFGGGGGGLAGSPCGNAGSTGTTAPISVSGAKSDGAESGGMWRLRRVVYRDPTAPPRSAAASTVAGGGDLQLSPTTPGLALTSFNTSNNASGTRELGITPPQASHGGALSNNTTGLFFRSGSMAATSSGVWASQQQRRQSATIYNEKRIRSAYDQYNALYERVAEGQLHSREREEGDAGTAAIAIAESELLSRDGAGVCTLHPAHVRQLRQLVDAGYVPLIT